MIATDWTELLAPAWGKEPALLTAAAPTDPAHLHRTVVAACASFRAGTVFRTFPQVRFHTVLGWLGAPGRLLPDTGDPTPAAYRARLRREPAGSGPDTGFLLRVQQPLHIDYSLWASVRDGLERLWRRVGLPCLPVEAELTEGDEYTCARGLAAPSEHAVLTWVLGGTLEAELHMADGPLRVLRATAGELLYWPEGSRWRERHLDGCLTLRISVPRAQRLAAEAVKNLLAEEVGKRLAYDGTVPCLPYPPPDGEPPAPTLAIGEAARAAAGGPELPAALRTRWAAWCSSAGLEPAPDPREDVTLAPGQRLRVVREILRQPDGLGRRIWAVNGHAFPVGGAAGELIAQQLPLGRELTVDELCGAVGVDAQNAAVTALLRKLYRLRGIEPAEAAETAEDGRADR
ncbi:hypothetical protein [Streptomyces sp. TRM68416]|uniref:hypothetical protein n=1 Tax=Streptomyces sp. TRM68416 TaxID=2758412 RepID=UPI00166207E5|nr:hypothetical protein [Streptomyces sp. TRM68416]MBD0838559.1 hypothetical protein [Streptomyces sp. TRM68416]